MYIEVWGINLPVALMFIESCRLREKVGNYEGIYRLVNHETEQIPIWYGSILHLTQLRELPSM
jgi:hypothetical protein